MAKKNIHPDYHRVTMRFPNNNEILTKSTFGKDNEIIMIEVDIATHPAWRADGASTINEKSSAVTKFRNKYGSVNLAGLMSDNV